VVLKISEPGECGVQAGDRLGIFQFVAGRA
jgi:hypothetical protein